jgi:dGTPase
MLSHLRFPADRSRGRRYPEPSHPYRKPYQRDRDRIIHARAFRRLEHKTQVFTSPHSDHFRNRLTHTIEVTQIARTVAAALGLNEDLTEALALSHDLGHPPFGHAGEEALDQEMRKHGQRFDHNLHALRIVETFEQRYAAFPGLNLTFEVREGIVKHSRDYQPEQYPELAEYLLDQRPPLEAQLIDLADEITYNCADLDDGVDAGLLRVEQVRAQVRVFHQELSAAEKQFPGASPRQIFNEALRKLLDRFVSGLIDGTQDRAAGAKVRTTEDVRRRPERLAALSDDAGEASTQLRGILAAEVYNSPVLDREHQQAGDRIARMFQFFVESPKRLPEPYRRRTGSDPIERVVCDYLAAMTDNFFLRCYGELFEEERLGG